MSFVNLFWLLLRKKPFLVDFSFFLKEGTRCLDVSRIKEHQPMTAEVLRIMQVSGGNVTTKRVLLCR